LHREYNIILGVIKKIILLIVPLVFLIVGIVTIRDYGINWDSPYRFNRGQAYFWYFLTGKKNYNGLPDFKISFCTSGNLDLFTKCKDKGESRSYYQYDSYDFSYWIVNDSGHPPLGDILASLSNYIFYQKFGLVNDVFSYHIFIVVSSFLLVLGIAYFVKSEFGIFPAIVSSIVLAGYPLFFSESHFNVKDPPETAFFGLMLIFFYRGIVKNNWKYILISSFATGLALGIKLNIVFAIFIVGPWLIYYLVKKLSPGLSFKKFLIFCKERAILIISLIIYLPISLGIVYATWPFLWRDTLRNVFKILGYYQQIGIGTPVELTGYIFKGWNLYPVYWILVTTSIPVLILLFLGLIFSIFSKKINKSGFSLFIILWFLTPIIRVSLPNTDIYGGVRQIMEFIPALAILCGIGTYALINIFKENSLKPVVYFLIITSLSFSLFEMIKIHPNENIYFNQIVGGLEGAMEKNIPYWGNTYGNVYLQGVKWINENAEKGAKVALPIGYISSIPRTMLRSDIDCSKPNWTGPNRGGEYGIEMYFEWPAKYWYSFQYYDKYLDPVYVYSVDGVSLLKIWKNDLEHTKTEFRKELVYKPAFVKLERNALNEQLKIDIGKEIFLTRLEINHSNANCKNQVWGYVAISSDGINWNKEVEPITLSQATMSGADGKITGWSDTNFVYLFAGKKARYIILDPQMENSCYLKDYSVKVMGLETLP